MEMLKSNKFNHNEWCFAANRFDASIPAQISFGGDVELRSEDYPPGTQFTKKFQNLSKTLCEQPQRVFCYVEKVFVKNNLQPDPLTKQKMFTRFSIITNLELVKF